MTKDYRAATLHRVIRWRDGVVLTVERSWPGTVELTADVAGTQVKALAYTQLVGYPKPNDKVLLNTTALDLRLGTGGYAQVIALADRIPETRPDGPGHLVKARYTPLQATVLGVDEQDSPWHEKLRDADDLYGMPVVVADLHSALPAILAGIYHAAPDARVAYVMTDGGALPAWFSRSVAQLREAEWLVGSITVGQAFGGDLEAVTLHTGLLAAYHVLHADICVVTQGPGNLGTGTRWGFSGVACGEAINATVTLGGRPVGALRVSDADARPRHHGISHHSLTAYGKVALAPADIVVPDLPGDFGKKIRDQATRLEGRHHIIHRSTDKLDEALRSTPCRLSTMGRGLDEDHAYFLASAAAGEHAADLLSHDS